VTADIPAKTPVESWWMPLLFSDTEVHAAALHSALRVNVPSLERKNLQSDSAHVAICKHSTSKLLKACTSKLLKACSEKQQAAYLRAGWQALITRETLLWPA
jgi:hypothetical protein